MNHQTHKRDLYKRIRDGRNGQLLGKVGAMLPRHIEYDEHYKLPVRGIDWAKAGEIARIDKGASMRANPAAVNPFRME